MASKHSLLSIIVSSIKQPLCLVDKKAGEIIIANDAMQPFAISGCIFQDFFHLVDTRPAANKNFLDTLWMESRVLMVYSPKRGFARPHVLEAHVSVVDPEHAVVLLLPTGLSVEQARSPFLRDHSLVVSFLETVPAPLHCCSEGRGGRVLWANACELQLLGCTRDEVEGRAVSEVFPQEADSEPSRPRGNEELHLDDCSCRSCEDGSTSNDSSVPSSSRSVSSVRIGGRAAESRCSVVAKTGTVRQLTVVSAPAAGGLFCGTLRDESEEQLKLSVVGLQQRGRVARAVATARNSFCRLVVHELRTPVHVLADLLASEACAFDAARARRLLTAVAGTVEDLSYAAHPRHGLAAQQLQAMRLEDSVEGVVETVREMISSRAGRSVNCALSVDPALAGRDALTHPALARALHHLVFNAVQFSADNGSVLVSLCVRDEGEEEGESYVPITPTSQRTASAKMRAETWTCEECVRVVFSVTNTAAGPADLARLRRCCEQAAWDCETFWDSDNCGSGDPSGLAASLSAAGGKGLGLCIAAGIVNGLGGRLDCRADSTGAEVCFSFALLLETRTASNSCPIRLKFGLPAVASAVGRFEGQSPRGESLSSARSTGMSPRVCGSVLVVDDSPIVQRMMERSLRLLGYRATVVGDGLQALQLLSRADRPCPFDCVLMDLRMPVMDGLTATQRCRKLPHLTRVPIVVISAESGEQIRRDALRAGANRFLSKPLRPDEIVRSIRELVDAQ